jgi:cytochrome P450
VLVAAGTDTTRLSTSLAIKTLIDHPEAFETLRANRELLPNAIMDLLRYESPTKFLVRSTLEDVDWKGQTIPAGSMILLSIFGAGWDPKVFDEPSRFDLARDLRGSLSFGFGSGYCLGVHLARLQVGELVSFFLDHMPAGATANREDITWDPRNLLLREVTSMPVSLR